jgi:hypothetical protein
MISVQHTAHTYPRFHNLTPSRRERLAAVLPLHAYSLIQPLHNPTSKFPKVMLVLRDVNDYVYKGYEGSDSSLPPKWHIDGYPARRYLHN